MNGCGPLGCHLAASPFRETTLPGQAGWRGRQPYS
jgi:hypothetical protein